LHIEPEFKAITSAHLYLFDIIIYHPFIMSDKHGTLFIKLAANGHNWVTYRDGPLSTPESRDWSGHLANTTIPRRHIDTVSINGLTPQARWTAEERVIKRSIGEVPDPKSKSKQSTMEVSDALKELYDDHTTTLVDLTRRVQDLRLREDDDVCVHFAKLDDMCGQLSAMGKDIDDEEYASILLASFPPCYSFVISGITTASAQTTGQPTKPQLAIDPITDDYDQHKIVKDKFNIGPEEALTTRHRKKKRSKPKCYKCRKKGHVKSECWVEAGDEDYQRPPKNKNSRNGYRDNNQGEVNANTANADTEVRAAIEEIVRILAAIGRIDSAHTDQPGLEQIDTNTTDQPDLEQITFATVEQIDTNITDQPVEQIQAAIRKIDERTTDQPVAQIAYSSRPQFMPPIALPFASPFIAPQIRTPLVINVGEEEPPTPTPAPRGKGKAKAKLAPPPLQSTRKSAHILKPSYYVTRLLRGEGTTTGHEEEPAHTPSTAERHWYHPDWPGPSASSAFSAADTSDFFNIEIHLSPVATAKELTQAPAIIVAFDSTTSCVIMAPPTVSIVPLPTSTPSPHIIGSIPTGLDVEQTSSPTSIESKDHRYCTHKPAHSASISCIADSNTTDPIHLAASEEPIQAISNKSHDIEQSHGQTPPGHDNEGEQQEQVQLLLKTIDDFKQAEQEWRDSLQHTLTQFDFRVDDTNPDVYYTQDGNDTTTLTIHSDCYSVTGTNQELVMYHRQRLELIFRLINLGLAHQSLGIKTIRDLEKDMTSHISHINTIINQLSPSPQPSHTTT